MAEKKIAVVILLLMINSVISTINVKLHKKISKFEQDHQNKLHIEFNKHKTLVDYIKSKKLGSRFYLKNMKNLKKSWDSYKRIMNRLESISSGNYHNINVVNFDESAFFAEISFGTPPQSFELQLDTGSSDLWSFSYNPNLSTSFVNLTQNYNRSYGQGASGNLIINGYLGEETVEFGGLNVKNYKIAVVTNENQQDSGLIGLGTQFISFTNATPLIEEIYNQGYIENPLFSFYFTQEPNSVGSQLILGNVDSKYYSGEIQYFDVNIKSWWEIKIKGFSVFGTIISYSEAFLDTGTSILAGPVKLVKEIQLVFNSNSGNPEAKLLIEDSEFPITEENFCPGGTLNFIAGQINFVVLGDTFLNLYYTVFDYQNYRVGIANLNPNLNKN